MHLEALGAVEEAVTLELEVEEEEVEGVMWWVVKAAGHSFWVIDSEHKFPLRTWTSVNLPQSWPLHLELPIL